MQTKHRIGDLLFGFAPALFVIVIPLFAVGLLLDSPYDLVAGIAVLIGARLIRGPLFARLRARAARSRQVPDHGVYRARG